jgi:hypothetical protein
MKQIQLDFIIAGAHRTGTTWLYENLYQHPEIILSSKRKELHFFDRDENFKKGLNFYNDFISNKHNKSLIGDVTPSYFGDEKVPERINYFFPKIKIIIILRNPIDRLFSHYKLNEGNSNNEESFSSYYKRKLNENEAGNSVEEGIYIKHIESYLKYFKKEQITVMFYKDLKEKPNQFYSKILKSIGVNNVEFSPKMLDQKVNSWSIKKHHSKSKFLYILMLAMKKYKLFNFSKRIERLNSHKKHRNNIEENDRKFLLNFYMDSIVELEKYLKINLDRWKK